jgi:uncharacterized 2Fe-2S/4Fe-4S cluster protein (DUF4445 family)
MTVHRVTLHPEGLSLEALDGASLADVLQAAEVPLALPCRRRGVCGKCLIEIVAGDAGNPDPSEREILNRRHSGRFFRLACRTHVHGPLTIRIPRESAPPKAVVLLEGRRREFAIDPPLKKIALTLPPSAVSDPTAAADVLKAAFSSPRPVVHPEALRGLAELDPDLTETITAVIYQDADILAIERGDTSARGFGAAIDLGTTTVGVEIVDLFTGRTVDAAAGVNGQIRFGADVVSRITIAHQEPGQSARLREAACRTINGLVAEAVNRAGVKTSEIYEIAIAGNTAMNHLFLGLPVATLAVVPFRALFSSIIPLEAAALGLDMNPAGRVYLAPNIKSFVGGDIAAGLAAIDFEKTPEKSLFIDLGTNGEIVLKNGPLVLTTSTAAGPAFEGMSLSCGMIAAPGAVCRAERSAAGTLNIGVIGDGDPLGICGSGLIDILAMSLESGTLSPDGQIHSDGKTLAVAPGIRIIQQDVREIQLASAAIKSGIRMLLETAGLSVEDLDRIYVAGAFGSAMNIRNAMILGLIPSTGEGRIEFVGNASLAGAKILLLSSGERKRCEEMIGRIGHLSLAQDPKFQDCFVEALEFGRWPI